MQVYNLWNGQGSGLESFSLEEYKKHFPLNVKRAVDTDAIKLTNCNGGTNRDIYEPKKTRYQSCTSMKCIKLWT